MTTREHMAALIAAGSAWRSFAEVTGKDHRAEIIAKDAVRIADALIRELAK